MYYKKVEDVFKELNTSKKGLTSQEADLRLHRYGLNELREEEKIHPLIIVLEQFKSPLIWILLVALVISMFIQEFVDAAVIGIIVILNAILGFAQEYRAEKAIEALRRMASLKAKVMRDGKEIIIDAVRLVPGDIILLETGDKIPADSRLIEIHNFQTQEAALTGESVPVKKDIRMVPRKTPVSDRKNMVYSGTIITKGRGEAIVASTGMETEFGKIATLIEQATEKLTPLQKKLRNLGRYLTIAVVLVAVVTFFAGIFTGKEVSFMLITAIALAVAAIPEGLPAVVTIALSIGVQRMVKRNALIRKLPSVETLGVVNVICSDKTGTLTHNQMTVTKIWANDNVYGVTGSGYQKQGAFVLDNKLVSPESLKTILQCGALCNDAKLKDNEGRIEVIGDPTEAALIVSAEKSGYASKTLSKQFPRVDEVPFSSERKMMTTIHKTGNKKISFTKGAPDIIIEQCNRILIQGKLERMTKQRKAEILKQNENFAKEALRVLGFAYSDDIREPERDMIFLGLQAMIDPPRKEVKESIQKCREAGIRVIMVTGDHVVTAQAIADQLGITGKAVTGQDINKIDLEKEIDQIAIFARVNPEHKIKIVEALKNKKYVVAMTGDGVNDAPAIKKADIGIAMGITGTDVAKEASDMILTDDNFTSIVNAVEEGRNIFDNIKKFVIYLLSSNSGEVLTIFIAILIGIPLPLLAVQILWINLVTDGAPATALGVEPPEQKIMQRAPRKSRVGILSGYNVGWIAVVGLIMMIGTLGIFYYTLKTGGWAGEVIDLQNPPYYYFHAITMAFCTLVMFQLFNVINCKTLKASVFKGGLFSNKWLIGAILFSLGLQLIVVYVPYLDQVFGTVPLSVMDWVLIVAVASSVLWLGEIIKLVKREKQDL
ncbi:calcium-translocating P-type ATPase, SERCA-type [Candidatus Woesearchaeota archaeon]|nr:calcium-translocating P-type ATPase, SERCA-type [Candidatus Woesearchaeota archaeon]